MSLSDYIKYLRAVKGGTTPWEIAEGCGVPAGHIHLMEVKHRRVGEDEETLQKLAQYFDVPIEEFIRRREAYRKRLSYFLEENRQKSDAVVLRLENQEEVEGRIIWYSRESVAITPMQDDASGHPYIVQRNWIADWRHTGSPEWTINDK